MKTTDDILQRLFHAACRATPGPEDLPLGLESRVLAAWRSQSGRKSFDPFVVLRPVLLGAVALACLVGVLEYRNLTDSADPATFVTNSAFLTAFNR